MENQKRAPQLEDMKAYVIRSSDGVHHVHVGTQQGATLKLNEVSKTEYDSWSDDTKEHCNASARRLGHKSGLEYFRKVDKWRVTPVEFTIEIKP